MSELRSVVERLRAEALECLAEARVEEDFDELTRAMEALELERLRRLAELDRRQVWARDGHLSAVAWLAGRSRTSWGEARAQVRIARSLAEMPLTRRAAEDGELSLSAARVLAEARVVDPEAFADAEAELVEAARLHASQYLRRVTAFWRDRVDRAKGMDPEGSRRAQRRLHASTTFLGMVRVDADLDPETGESLLTAIRAVLDAEARTPNPGDMRTSAQRRADALGEVCRGFLDRSDRPDVAGERPHVVVTVDEAALRADEGMADLDHSGPVPATVARRVACDASVRRVVMAGRSEPLDVGRRTSVVPPSMRRAVIVRDHHCRFPGCDRPHSWCDAHHIVHWADGGATAIQNLVLLCRRHHRMVHDRGGFGLELVDGRPVFKRRDGSTLDGRAPP
jgi:Domain of unknown function (DUF222)/HNH endonuclease